MGISCSDARLPTALVVSLCWSEKSVYGDLRPRGVSFDCCSNSALANSIAFARTFSLSGPLGVRKGWRSRRFDRC